MIGMWRTSISGASSRVQCISLDCVAYPAHNPLSQARSAPLGLCDQHRTSFHSPWPVIGILPNGGIIDDESI